MIKGYVYTVAGNGTAGYSGDGGPASSAALSGPEGVAVEAGGNLLIADTGNDRVRLVTTVGTPSSSVSAPSVGTVGMSISGSAVTAIVSGGYSPSGSVSFRVFGPQAAAPASCAAGGSSVGSGSVAGDGSYSPVGGFTPSGAGDYWWYVSYGGDANNNPAASTCGSGMAETVIANAPPSPHPTAHPGLTVPVLSKLALSTHKLSLSGRRAGGRCVRRDSRNERHRHCQLQLRLKVTFRLSMRASVKFTLRHRLPGRMAKGACIKQTRRDRHERRCTRWVGVRGTLTETRGAGSRSFTFDGKLDGRRLRPGVYQLAASPGAAGERGTAHRITFTIAG